MEKLHFWRKKYFRWFAVSTCPPGQVLASPDMSKSRLLVQFRTFRVQNFFFKTFLDDAAWFCLEKLKKHNKFGNRIWKCVKSAKIKAFPLVRSKYLSSWTGLGRSGHDRSQSFGLIWHVSGPKISLSRNDLMILHHFCWRNSKIKLFWSKTLIFN